MHRLKNLKKRLNNEQEILGNRLVMGGASGISAYFVGAAEMITTAFFVYLSCNIILLLLEIRNKLSPPIRILCGIALDFSMVFTVMKIDPVGMAVFYPLMLWVILGNGFRFGIQYLFVASLGALIAFGGILFTTPYWADNQILGYGLLAALIMIPAYCSTLIRKLSNAKEEAVVANEAKSYFLASVSHELRTPLNAIIAYGNHLKDTRLVPSQKQMVEASVLAGEHLLHLFDQLIQISRSDAAAVEQKDSDFAPAKLLAGVRDIMEVRASEKGLYLRVQAEVNSDEMKRGPAETIRNIMMNLISNAIKFTESGGVSVTMRVREVDGEEELQFEVTDTGIGIAKDAQKIIFEAFQQADNSVSGRFGGTGLGLAICHQLIGSISGSIEVSSEIGKGSRFQVCVPLREIASIGVEAEQTTSSTAPQRLIAFGEFGRNILIDANYAENFDILHISCDNKSQFEAAIAKAHLEEFQVALVDQRLVANADADDPLWDIFASHLIAPVLVQHDSQLDFEDISLRAAFASVVPASADFNELRSAIRIGCSFARISDGADEDTEPTKTAEPQSILVADDNRTNRNILSTILEAAGHHVTMAADGDEALSVLEGGQFDIFLLDVNMPRLNGIDVSRMWRQIEGGRSRIPIIGVTADATEETRQACLNAGMDMRITKPIDAKELLQIIDEKCSGGSVEIDMAEIINDPLSKVVSLNNPRPVAPETGSSVINPEQIDYLLSIGDQSFLESMIEGYKEDTDENLPNFQHSIKNQNVEEFRYCAHAFKSSANNIGAVNMAQICGELEMITQSDFEKNGGEYLYKVECELEKTITALDQILIQHSPDKKTA